MNCDDLRDCLSKGQPVTGEAAEHVRECAGCRAMLAALNEPGATPDWGKLDGVRRSIVASWAPVRPLPANGAMISIALLLFVLFSTLATVPFGFQGFHGLGSTEKFFYYTGIFVCAVLLSLVTVEQMVPGSRRRVSPGIVIGCSLLVLTAVAVFLFPNFDLQHFVPQGIPCLRLGTCCAAISGGLGYLLLRKGFFTTAVQAGAAAGFFAGLTGVAVLSLHCTLKNAAHILVWHLGAMLIAGAAGALAGYAGLRLSRSASFPH